MNLDVLDLELWLTSAKSYYLTLVAAWQNLLSSDTSCFCCKIYDRDYFAGESLKKAGSFMSAAVLAGVLKSNPAAGDGVTLNLINAPALAKQLGVEV